MSGVADSSEAQPRGFTKEQLAEARVEGIFSYDTTRFPFKQLFERMFQLEEEMELDRLHTYPLSEKPPLSLALIHGFKVAGYKCPKTWNKAMRYKKDRLRKFCNMKAFKDFQATFSEFVEEVIVPLVGDDTGVVYQNPPTTRVQVPSARAIGIPHKDSDYDCHVDTEVNIWLPITSVYGANTLQVESEPGKEDFHPLECEYGQFVRFWGNQCHHYTLANTTDSTRVSFDFRVIPRSLYTDAYKGYIGDYPVLKSGERLEHLDAAETSDESKQADSGHSKLADQEKHAESETEDDVT